MLNINKMWKNINMKREVKEVDFDEINLNEYVIIDVRSRREYLENHLNSAINIPLPNVKKYITKYVKDKNKKILVYCRSGQRSKKAIQIMQEIGYTMVFNLKDGIENI